MSNENVIDITPVEDVPSVKDQAEAMFAAVFQQLNQSPRKLRRKMAYANLKETRKRHIASAKSGCRKATDKIKSYAHKAKDALSNETFLQIIGMAGAMLASVILFVVGYYLSLLIFVSLYLVSPILGWLYIGFVVYASMMYINLAL